MNSHMDALLDVELPVTVRFGSTQMSLEDVMRLERGSAIEFRRTMSEPVEVLVNGRVVARGEAVVVQGNYGVRVTELVARKELLNSGAAPAGDRK